MLPASRSWIRRSSGFLRRIPLPRLGTVVAIVSILALMVLSYVFGAAALFFDLPPAGSLRKAFLGARAWSEREQARQQPPRFPSPAGRRDLVVVTDKSDRTCDGFTLCTTNEGPAAVLIDMRGNAVHRWKLPFNQAWRKPAAGLKPFREDQIHWFRCHLYPNGDLLAVYHAEGDTPYGYGLAKMDKDSKLLWVYPESVHHDVDVDEEGKDGTIYTLTQKLVATPPDGMEWFPTPYIADYLAVLSSEGKELETIPILEAFRDSPYELTFSFLDTRRAYEPSLRIGPGPVMPPPPPTSPIPPVHHKDSEKGDYLHANSVRVLRRSLAPKFPLFQVGQVLLSLRTPNTLAVLDRGTRSIVWAAPGIWRGQHDAEFLDNGNLLVFDNHGSMRGARVLEYDPRTQAFPWCYAGENSAPFHAVTRGRKQRLANGNTLVVDPDGGRLVEVTKSKDCVWECLFPLNPGASITGACRYASDRLTFLKGGPRARP